MKNFNRQGVAADVLASLNESEMTIASEPLIEPPLAFCHYHESNTDRAGTWSRLPCFAFAATHAILPAFGQFTGMHVIFPNDFEQLFVVADDQVVKM